MKVLLIILGVLLLIGMIPVGVIFRYREAISLKLQLAFFRLTLLPKKPKTRKQLAKAEGKKKKKAAKKAEKKKKQQAQSLIAKPPAPPKPKKPLKDKIEELVPLAKLGVRFVGEFVRRKLVITRLYVRAALAGGDPSKTAQTVGKAWEAIGTALPILDRAFKVKRRKLVVYPDFTASKTELEVEARIRLRIGGVVCILVKYGFRALKLLRARKKARKAKAARKAAAGPNEQTEQTSESTKSTKLTKSTNPTEKKGNSDE